MPLWPDWASNVYPVSSAGGDDPVALEAEGHRGAKPARWPIGVVLPRAWAFFRQGFAVGWPRVKRAIASVTRGRPARSGSGPR